MDIGTSISSQLLLDGAMTRTYSRNDSVHLESSVAPSSKTRGRNGWTGCSESPRLCRTRKNLPKDSTRNCTSDCPWLTARGPSLIPCCRWIRFHEEEGRTSS